MSGVPAGTTLELAVEDPERGSAASSYKASEANDRTTLVLEPLQILSGKVVDTQGMTVSSCRLYVMSTGKPNARYKQAVTDASGEFRLEVPLGEYTIEFDGGPAGAQALDHVCIAKESTPQSLLVELETTSAIRVHVTDSDGNEVARASVRVEPLMPGGERSTGSTDKRGWVALMVPEEAYAVNAERGDLASETVRDISPGDKPVNLELHPKAIGRI